MNSLLLKTAPAESLGQDRTSPLLRAAGAWWNRCKTAAQAYGQRFARFREIGIAALGLAISMSILAMAIRGLGSAEVRGLLATAPRSLGFWLVFAATYLLVPATEWVIYRRIWSIAPAAIFPLLRKQVANGIVLGYSGDAHFYIWARRDAKAEGSVFGTVRDVAILSALAGNLATLLMMIGTAPFLFRIATGPILNALVGSVGIIVVTSLAVFAVQRRLSLLTLSKRDLVVTFGLHCARIGLNLLLSAMLLNLLMPSAGIDVLVVVATLQMMVGRLPLLPAREAVLAGLCTVLLGAGSGVAGAMTLIATLTIASNILVGLAAMLGAAVHRLPLRRDAEPQVAGA